jgi:hypothetical protein
MSWFPRPSEQVRKGRKEGKKAWLFINMMRSSLEREVLG